MAVKSNNASAQITPAEREILSFKLGQVFRPSSPVDQRTLFAGRRTQLTRVLDTIHQPGQHVAVYGERGVGKTSLVSILAEIVGEGVHWIIAPRINCETGDTFSTLWHKVFAEIQLEERRSKMGFTTEKQGDPTPISFSDELPDCVGTEDVRRLLTILSDYSSPIIILDEFDRISDKDVTRTLADTIKTLSDHSVDATIVVVGVADSIDQLIEQHQSVERALVQIRMPRMAPSEIREIVVRGLNQVEMKADEPALDRIALLSHGLPHYAHLIGLFAAREALDSLRTTIALADVMDALPLAIDNANQSVRKSYDQATKTVRKDTLYREVLLACALSQQNEFGFFAAGDLRGALREITGRAYEIPTFVGHLAKFCDSSRGSILSRDGDKHQTRYRFKNPLMQPFIIANGVASGLVNEAQLAKIGPS